MKTIFKGANKLNTKDGHRLLRHIGISGYNQMVSGERDFRVLRLERGATELAERMGGSTSNKLITNINEIVHFMAYFKFQRETESELSEGNLIQLSTYKSPVKTNRQAAYEITIGTMLLPFQTFTDHGLLIPLLQDPPLVNPNQTHASQYLLQMELMEEFCNQSILLAQEGAVEITQKLWEKLALACHLSTDVLKKVQDRWIQDGTDGAQFLVKVEDDFYTLGSEHQKSLDFLKQQGELRIAQSNRGLLSASRRRYKRKDVR
jgi:hypothetical protein